MAVRKIELMYSIFGKDSNRMRCGDCSNFIHRTGGYNKCKVYGESSSEATDWRVSYIACGNFNKEYNGNPVVKRVVKERSREKNVEGQMKLF